ncbi:uncharacterized protein [Nicotiana sylvestris]|uniref:uncharacterized protein n=1 Tax=Nicotiana sylvestris TaxID=4096 RepID=UPI00388CA0FA
MWASHPSFPNIINRAFSDHSNLLQSIDSFKTLVTKWNQEVFGNIFHQKRRILARIFGIQRSPSYQFSSYLLHLETNLTAELNLILKNKEDFWKLKSRINWLNEGDVSTRFFHISTLNRRRRNIILSLKEENGNRLHEQKDIHVAILGFFTDLYTTSHTKAPRAFTSHSTISPILSESQRAFLDRPLDLREIKKGNLLS